jgi:hypothetical protein
MHLYVCPYCVPSVKAHLFLSKEKAIKCDCKKGIFNKDKECKKKKYKCKEVWRCRQCRECWIGSEEFLESQKRKIKDG